MARVRCPHCGEEIVTGTGSFTMLMPIDYSIRLHKIAAKEGVSISSLINNAILDFKKGDAIPLFPPSNLSVGFFITEKAKTRAEALAKIHNTSVRKIIRASIAKAFYTEK